MTINNNYVGTEIILLLLYFCPNIFNSDIEAQNLISLAIMTKSDWEMTDGNLSYTAKSHLFYCRLPVRANHVFSEVRKS